MGPKLRSTLLMSSNQLDWTTILSIEPDLIFDNPRVMKRLRVSYGYLIGAVLTVHLLSNTFGYTNIAGPAFLTIVALLCAMVASRYSWLTAVLAVVFGMLFFSFSTQLLGEVTGSWATSRLMMSTYLGSITVIIRVLTKPYQIRLPQHIYPLIAAAVSSILWLFIVRLDSATVLTFLGYGYDNIGHLMQSRIIAENGGSVLISGGSEIGPTFMQDSTQVGGSLIASLASLMGITFSDVFGLMAILAAISIAIPVISITAVIVGFVTGVHSRYELVLISATTVAIIATGYLSRIWFSGYLGSNLGTMCAVLIAIYVATNKIAKVSGVLLLVIIMIHTYPLFSIIGTAFLISFVIQVARTRRESAVAIKEFSPLYTLIFVGVIGLLLFLPYHATGRSYGSSQFLTDGGIESFPTTFFMLLLLVFLVPLTVMIAVFGKQKSIAISHAIYAIVGFGIAAYSFRNVHKLAYYPTKFAITFFLMLLGSVIASSSQVEIGSARKVFLGLTLVLASTYVLLQPQSEVFRSAYMGEMPKVLTAAQQAKVEVVKSNVVIELADISRANTRPLLFLSNTYESELNTRWINTLSLQWNDNSWGRWMKIRALIDEKKFGELGNQVEDKPMIIVTDDVDLYEQIKPTYLGMVCLRGIDLICNQS